MDIEKIQSIIDEEAATGCSITYLGVNEKHSFSYGTYSEHNLKKISEDTVFDLASISKLYTTALTLRLHERGILNLNAFCHTYLDIFQDSALKIIDLLTQKAAFNVRLSQYREPLIRLKRKFLK